MEDMGKICESKSHYTIGEKRDAVQLRGWRRAASAGRCRCVRAFGPRQRGRPLHRSRPPHCRNRDRYLRSAHLHRQCNGGLRRWIHPTMPKGRAGPPSFASKKDLCCVLSAGGLARWRCAEEKKQQLRASRPKRLTLIFFVFSLFSIGACTAERHTRPARHDTTHAGLT